MKKFFLFAAAIVAAMTINAQTVVVLNEVANYIDFEALSKSDADMTAATIDSEHFYTLGNGSVLKGYKNAEGAEASVEWNTKDTYNTTMPTPEWQGVDSLKAGTMFRAASGVSIELGAFKTKAAGKLVVYFQPNGDSNRGVEISLYGDVLGTFEKSGVKIDNIRPAYAAEVELPAGVYDAGDVVIKLVVNKSNIFGVRIEALQGEGIDNVSESVKAVKTFENGQLVIIKNGVRYNALGAKL